MQMSRTRIWILSLLLIVYLAGVLLLSAVTLHEPRNNGLNAKVTDHGHQAPKSSRNLEFGVPGLRLPLRRSRIQWCTDLRYLQPPQEPVALASFPGSGNTWLRYLLQQATGGALVNRVQTGSVYKDYGLLKNGFPAESVVNGSVLVVKTHEWGPLSRQPFGKAILLVRAPGPAIQAEFNRQSGGHVGFATPERYKRNRGKYWYQFVYEKLQAWKQMNLDWLHNFTGPTHVIFYEQLVENVQHSLKTIIDFLEVPLEDDLLRCALQRKEGIYRRKRKVLTFDPFTAEMKKRMKREQQFVYEEIFNMASPARRRKK